MILRFGYTDSNRLTHFSIFVNIVRFGITQPKWVNMPLNPSINQSLTNLNGGVHRYIDKFILTGRFLFCFGLASFLNI